MDQDIFPKRIDGYEVAESLGKGSFAEAYRGKSPDGADCVIKLLRVDAPIDGERRFLNEAWALEKLIHDAISKFIAEGKFESRAYIVMSLAPGVSLRKRLTTEVQERGTFGERWVLRIVHTVLGAVRYMQTQDIAHRDIKDDNIVCDDRATKITLLDFGFCKGPSQPVDADSFLQVGAPRYSSPSKLRFPSQFHPITTCFQWACWHTFCSRMLILGLFRRIKITVFWPHKWRGPFHHWSPS